MCSKPYFAQKLLRMPKVVRGCENRKKLLPTAKVAQKLPSAIATCLILVIPVIPVIPVSPSDPGRPIHPCHSSHSGHPSHKGHIVHSSHLSQICRPSCPGRPVHPSHPSHLGHPNCPTPPSWPGLPGHPSHPSSPVRLSHPGHFWLTQIPQLILHNQLELTKLPYPKKQRQESMATKNSWRRGCVSLGYVHTTQRSHMTSRRPDWCSKTMKWRPLDH